MEGLHGLLTLIPPLAAGPSGWHKFPLQVLVEVLRFSKKRGLAVEPLSAYIDLLNASISLLEEKPDLSSVALVRRENDVIDQALLPRIGLDKEGKQMVLQFADLEVPVLQEKDSFKIGTLASEDAYSLVLDNEGKEQKVAEGEDPLPKRYQHRITLTDSETDDEFEILLLTRTDIEIKGKDLQKALAAGKPLSDLLRPLPTGNGGGLAVAMKDWIRDNAIAIPSDSKIVGYRKVPSKSVYRAQPFAWAAVLDNGQSVFLRGGSEQFFDQHADHLDSLLAEMGYLVLKVTEFDDSDPKKVRIKNSVSLPMDGMQELMDLQEMLLSSASAPKSLKPVATPEKDPAPKAKKPQPVAEKVAVAAGDAPAAEQEGPALDGEEQENVDMLTTLGF